jgi:hypothetical protein
MRSAYKPLPHPKISRNEFRAIWSSSYSEPGNDIFETSNNSKIYKNVHTYICVMCTYKIINSLYLLRWDVHKKTNKVFVTKSWVLACAEETFETEPTNRYEVGGGGGTFMLDREKLLL